MDLDFILSQYNNWDGTIKFLYRFGLLEDLYMLDFSIWMKNNLDRYKI